MAPGQAKEAFILERGLRKTTWWPPGHGQCPSGQLRPLVVGQHSIKIHGCILSFQGEGQQGVWGEWVSQGGIGTGQE